MGPAPQPSPHWTAFLILFVLLATMCWCLIAATVAVTMIPSQLLLRYIRFHGWEGARQEWWPPIPPSHSAPPNARLKLLQHHSPPRHSTSHLKWGPPVSSSGVTYKGGPLIIPLNQNIPSRPSVQNLCICKCQHEGSKANVNLKGKKWKEKNGADQLLRLNLSQVQVVICTESHHLVSSILSLSLCSFFLPKPIP